MADTIKKNNRGNVSTVKGVAGGYLFSAPVGTSLPENFWDPLDEAFECLGFVTEDGLKEAPDGSADDIKDMSGDIVGQTDESTTETLVFALMEISEMSLATRYGHDNVDGNDASQIVVDHNWAKAKEERSIVADLVMKNGRRWRKVIADSTVSERGEMQLNGANVASHEVTVKYLSDSEGSYCKDYIQQVDAQGKPVMPPEAGSAEPQPDGAEKQQGSPEAEALSAVGGRGVAALQDMTIAQLRSYAGAKGVDLTGKSTKQDIIDAILAAV